MSIDQGQPSRYDARFPIPGINQPSEQFRTNFQIIRTAVENLQTVASTPDSVVSLETAMGNDGRVLAALGFRDNGLVLPIGRPTRTPEPGMLAYDPVAQRLEFHNGDWSAIGATSVSLAGDITGTGTMGRNGAILVQATLAPDAVVLGQNTTGDYVARVTAGSGIVVSGSPSEGADLEISVDSTGLLSTVIGSSRGLTIVRNTNTGRLDFDVLDPVIAVSGSMTGSATMTNLSDTTIPVIARDFDVTLTGGISGTGTVNDLTDVTINTTARQFSVSLTGDVFGTGVVTNLQDAIIVTQIADNSHAHFWVIPPGQTKRALDFGQGISGFDAVSGPDMPENDPLDPSFYTGLVSMRVGVAGGQGDGARGMQLATKWNAELDAPNRVSVRTKDDSRTVWSAWRDLVWVDELAEFSSLGTGSAVYKGLDTLTNTHQFKSLTAGNAIRLTTGPDTIDIAVDADYTIALSGDVSGTATVTDLGDVTITTIVADDSHNHTSATITDLTETVQDIVGGMVTGNSENGISVTYHDITGRLDFDVNDPTITLTGPITGSGTMVDLDNVSIATTARSFVITLSGDVSGSATVTNLGDVALTTSVTTPPALPLAGGTMTGDIMFPIVGNAASKGVRWAGLSDAHAIFVEETANSERTRMVFEAGDNVNAASGTGPDGFQFRLIGNDAATVMDVLAMSSQGATFTTAVRGHVQTITGSGTIVLDFARFNYFDITATGPITLATPTGLMGGQGGSIVIRHDNATITYGSAWRFAGGVRPALTASTGVVDRLDYLTVSTTEIHANLAKDIR